MRTHYAVVRSSGRIVPVEVAGSIFIVLSDRSYHGPYRRHDRRFILLARTWRPTPFWSQAT
jgi:hypothetical protein